MGTFYVTQEGPVNALALNRDYTQVIIGGRNGLYFYYVPYFFHKYWLILKKV